MELHYDELLSSSAFNFNLRRHTTASSASVAAVETDMRRLQSVMPALVDPAMDSAVVVEGLTVDAKSEVRRAKDRAMARGTSRLEETREGELDTDAQVREERPED